MGLQRDVIQWENGQISHYYLCNYLPVSAGRDTLSHSLMKFKRGEEPDLSGWIDCSLQVLGDILPAGTTIVRALHHHEKTIGDRPEALDHLGAALASAFHCAYRPRLLRKSRVTCEIKTLSRRQRDRELTDLYYIAPADAPAPTPVPAPPILLIDDVLTTATTAKKIIAVLRRHYPAAGISLFTLAKADYDARLNRSTILEGRNYRLEQGLDWVLAEEDPPSYYSPGQLRSWILSGNWPAPPK